MQRSEFLHKGFRVCRLFGIDIWVHWILAVMLTIMLLTEWVKSGADIVLTLSYPLIILTSILLHEFGHCYAAKRVGGGARSIILWPLGGLAECDYPQIPMAKFWVSLGGPLVNVALAILFSWAFFIEPNPESRFSEIAIMVGEEMVLLNSFLLIFNLLPIYPLDGGQIFFALAWKKFGSLGKAGWTTVVTTRIAIPTVIILGIVANALQIEFLFIFGGIFMIFILAWCWLKTETLKQELEHMEEDYVFGYNFSQGYTSLESSGGSRHPSKPRRPGFFARLKQKRLAKEQEARAQMKAEVDRLLDKISQEGMNSLSKKERQFLEVASKKLQEDSSG